MMDHRRRSPLIGVTLDSEPAGGYSKFPWYALRRNYADSIVAAGGLPVALPHHQTLAKAYLDVIDGLVVTGGAFDVDPNLYGAGNSHQSVVTKTSRTTFEWAMTEQAFECGLPILGICGGQQLINVVFGGSLIQHIPDAIEDCLHHEQPNPRDQPGHNISVVEGSLLHRLVGVRILPVNSAHHQAVDRVAPGFDVSAVADDGVIEAIEHREYPFCIGVQWHPEFEISDGDRAIMRAFIARAAAAV